MSGDNLHMSRHSLAPTQSPRTIVSAKRRNLGRVSTALGQSLPIAPRWYPGKGEQGITVSLLARTIFTVQTASSTRLVDSVFNKLSQASLENHPRRGQSRIYGQTLVPSDQKSSQVCARLRC